MRILSSILVTCSVFVPTLLLAQSAKEAWVIDSQSQKKVAFSEKERADDGSIDFPRMKCERVPSPFWGNEYCTWECDTMSPEQPRLPDGGTLPGIRCLSHPGTPRDGIVTLTPCNLLPEKPIRVTGPITCKTSTNTVGGKGMCSIQCTIDNPRIDGPGGTIVCSQFVPDLRYCSEQVKN